MLAAIRHHSKGWISGIIVGAIVLTFALFGIGSYLEGPNQGIVATVNGYEIGLEEYRDALQRQRRALSNLRSAPAALLTPDEQRQVLEQLIDLRLLDQYVIEQGYQPSVSALQAAIFATQAFHTDGVFDPDRYRALLAQNGLSPAAYEAGLRQQIAGLQLQSGLDASAIINPAEVSALLAHQTDRRIGEHTRIPVAAFAAQVAVQPADLQAEYRDNPDAYREPPRLRVEYLELKLTDLAGLIEPDEAGIQQFWQANRGRYLTPEVRRASHILLAADPQDSTARAEAEARARVLADELANGRDFAALAAEHSEDAGSSARGGDLGVITPGQLDPVLENAIFALRSGEVSAPIASDFGYHLIRLTELIPGRQKTLAEVQDEITAAWREQQAERVYSEQGENLRNLAFEYPDTLQIAADELDLPIQTSDWFSAATGTGLFIHPRLREAAFNPEVAEDGLNSEVIELDFDHMVALRLLDSTPARLPPLDEVAPQVEAAVRAAQARDAAEAQGQAILDQLNGGVPWPQALEQAGLTAEPLPEGRAGLPPRLAARLYAARAPLPAYEGVPLAGGDYALFRLQTIEPAAPNPALEQALTQLMRNRDGTQLYEQLPQVLRQTGNVWVNEEQISLPADY